MISHLVFVRDSKWQHITSVSVLLVYVHWFLAMRLELFFTHFKFPLCGHSAYLPVRNTLLEANESSGLGMLGEDLLYIDNIRASLALRG